MLISKPLTAGAVVVLKMLREGPDVVGRLTEDYANGDYVSIRKPIEAHMVNGQTGLGLAFAPFSLAAEDDQVFRIPRTALLVDPFPARAEVLKTYTEHTSSLKLL
jgi:hypothetical protein